MLFVFSWYNINRTILPRNLDYRNQNFNKNFSFSGFPFQIIKDTKIISQIQCYQIIPLWLIISLYSTISIIVRSFSINWMNYRSRPFSCQYATLLQTSWKFHRTTYSTIKGDCQFWKHSFLLGSVFFFSSTNYFQQLCFPLLKQSFLFKNDIWVVSFTNIVWISINKKGQSELNWDMVCSHVEMFPKVKDTFCFLCNPSPGKLTA